MKCGIKNCAGLYFPEDANCCTNECGESEACINDDDGRCGGDDDNDDNADATDDGRCDGDDDNDGNAGATGKKRDVHLDVRHPWRHGWRRRVQVSF